MARFWGGGEELWEDRCSEEEMNKTRGKKECGNWWSKVGVWEIFESVKAKLTAL